MKKIFKLILASLLIFSLTSCLKDNTEEIDAYSDNHISDVVGVWFRYITKENNNGKRDVLKKIELDGISKKVDKDNKKVTIEVAPTAKKIKSIPTSNIGELTINNLAVVVALPTGARIFPVGDSPKLGVNGDWSKPNKYIVKAANGNEAEWEIEITSFTK